MSEWNVELVALFRAILEDFGGRLTVARPDIGDEVQKAIAQVCAGVQAKCEEKREQIAKCSPEELAGAAQFLHDMRINFLEATSANIHFC
jgi:hypothetical protein